jgi:hypothetical protein
MPVPVVRLLRRLTLAVLALLVAAIPSAADDAALAAHRAELKRMEIRFMMREARERQTIYAERKRELERERKGKAKAGEVGEKLRPEHAGEPPDPVPAGHAGVRRLANPAAALSIATNRIMNNRVTDTAPASGQCEVSIAAFGLNVVAAWNDGEGFANATSTQGFAYSTDGGQNWVDGGAPPSTNVTNWTSDPVVVVNEKTGDFYFSALCEPSGTTNGIGVVKGTFSGGVLTWGTPEVAISGTNSTVIYDKEWLAADSTSGNLYLVYSRFTVSGGNITTNRIDFQRKVGVAAFSAPTRLSSLSDDGLVQGARVVMGPAGLVWATWNAIGLTDVDFMRVRRAPLGGTPFGTEVTAVSQFTNYGSGAPGFNRGTGFAFPSLAVDRSTGPHRGRAYLAWNESINFFNDNLGTAGTIPEVEPNNVPGNATPFTMGKHLTGNISPASDFDYFQFTGTAGQTIICQIDAATAPSLDASFRLFCSDATTRLAFSETGFGGSGLIVFTLPSSGTYTLRVASLDGTGTGAYVIDTALNGVVTERARDHRDVFTTFSDNLTTWSTPVRLNDEPANLDDWLPEVAVSSAGNVYASWYDWRDGPGSVCGGASMMYLSRSADGATWPEGSPVSDNFTSWTGVSSNIAPNQGDYTSLFANQNSVYVCWSDGRNGDPDAFMAAPLLLFTPVLVSVSSTEVEPGLVRVTWYTADGNGFAASVYRRTDSGEWADLGPVSPDGTGRIVYEDRAITAGTRYHYRLGVVENGQESFLGEVMVEVPATSTLAIEAIRPNPADREMWVSFSLPLSEPATLDVIDVSGRRVFEQVVSGTGRHSLDLAAGKRLAPGVYLVRLTQAGKSVVMRASVVR